MKYTFPLYDGDILISEVNGNDLSEVYLKCNRTLEEVRNAKHIQGIDGWWRLYDISKENLAKYFSSRQKEKIDSYKNLLNFIVKSEYSFNWNILKDSSKFTIDKPLPPSLEDIPSQPKAKEPVFSYIEKIIGSKLKRKKITETNEDNEKRYQEWINIKEEIEKRNEDLEQEYELMRKEREKWYSDFIVQQKEKNLPIDTLRLKYQNDKSADIIKKHTEYVLRNIKFPSVLNYKIRQNDFRVFYNDNSNILIIDFQLIPKEDFLEVKDIKYIKSQSLFKEVMFSVREFNLLYETYIFQITLSVTYCLFSNDVIDRIESIVFNGWVNSIDRATGNKVNKCILSVQFRKNEFLNLNLKSVDAKECFRHFKGIGSPKLHELIPVAPILTITKEDKRFVQSYEVVKELDESINLAAMDWEDFEHLVRELFEKEFSQNGGEVKITRASRDGGVDAVAFDPDPIRGGKIVIQAKRYTNIVGVNAVRDLFGTVMNEGALKGILVTTSDYGSDAYEFAKDKPITLLTGNNLLHLLEKHGHKAKIDIEEAKQIFKKDNK